MRRLTTALSACRGLVHRSVPSKKLAFNLDIVCRYDKEGEPEFASARLWDDGVIDPADTRRVLSLALAAACNSYRHSQPRYGVFRM